jgi:hypothetical protein
MLTRLPRGASLAEVSRQKSHISEEVTPWSYSGRSEPEQVIMHSAEDVTHRQRSLISLNKQNAENVPQGNKDKSLQMITLVQRSSSSEVNQHK